MATFSHLKHLVRGDVFFDRNVAVILIKWSKTLQLNNQARLLKIPRLNNEICPFLALKKCLSIVPGDTNAPLFQFKIANKWTPMMDGRVRKHPKNILLLLGKDPSHITFHSFRRSGALFAFNNSRALARYPKAWHLDV